ncbi:hypothetical protein MAR_026161 [Mya arenaria]|uniref:DZIP3-like HEPN domain-containing protein n=1 Tax=Mya arenaria TaxID=6604 RepID=A0ABY7EXT1_MYAAR|nr:hypothetical protein MAR_026161 [Mya arenaria]
MAALTPEVTDLNFIRIISLFSEIGKDCLLKAFYSFVQKGNVQSYFQSDKIQNRIDDLLKSGILVGDQYDKLKDENIKPHEFDLAMLFVLLRYVIEEVPAPVKGWNILPSVGDNSLGACLLKVQRIRNEVVHNLNVKLGIEELEEKWDDLAHYLRVIIESVCGREDSKKVSKRIRELKNTSKEDLSRNLTQNVDQVFLWSASDFSRLQSKLAEGQIRSNSETQQSQKDGLDEPDAKRIDPVGLQSEVENIAKEFQAISVDELSTQTNNLPSTSTDSSHVVQKLNDMTRKVNDIYTWVQEMMLRLHAQAPQPVPMSRQCEDNSLPGFGSHSVGTTSSLPSLSSVQGSSGTIVTNMAQPYSINVMGGKLNTAPGSYISIRNNFHCWDLNEKKDPDKKGVEDFSNLSLENTYVSFTDSPLEQGIRYQLESYGYRDTEHDLAVLQIRNPDDHLPPPMLLRKEGIDPLFLNFISIIGFGHPEQNRTNKKNFEYKCQLVTPNSNEMRSALVWLKNYEHIFKKDLYVQGKDPKYVELGYGNYDADFKILFHCFMEHGSSGSPIIRICPSALNTAASVEVVGVVTHGIPAFFFDLSTNGRILVPHNKRFEAGSRMEHIFKQLHSTNYTLAAELFNLPDVRESDFHPINRSRETAV